VGDLIPCHGVVCAGDRNGHAARPPPPGGRTLVRIQHLPSQV